MSLFMCAQLSTAVFAESVTAGTAEDTGISTAPVEGEDMPEFTDDPSYWKYYANKNKVGAVYGSENLTHNSRFDGVTKEYGVDISYYQTYYYNVDWSKVKAAGINYVIVRLGYRGYGSAGTLVLDSDFHKNLQGAIDAGLDVGVYFFTQAINTAEAKAEAQFCIDALKGYELDLPVYYDIEGIDYDTGRLDSANLSKSEQTNLCRTFCETITAAGYYAGIYSNSWYLGYKIDGAGLGEDYPIWVADYGTSCSYSDTYDMWQYSGYGWVDGFDTYVDLNVHYKVNYAPTGTVKLTKSGSTLSWNSVSGATGYTVYSKDSSGNVKTVKTQTGTSYTVSSPSGLTYYVKAYRTYGGKKYYGSASNSVQIMPAKVTGLKQTSAGTTSVGVSWTAVSGASAYEVYVDSGSGYKLATTSTTTSCTVSGLGKASESSIKVRAFISSGGSNVYGDYSSVITVRTAPNAPGKYSLVKASRNYVTIDWDNNEGVCDGYEVSFYDKNDGYTVIGTSTESGYTIYGLEQATNYQIVLRAYVTVNGKKYYSPYNTVRTLTTAPNTTTGLYVKDFGNNNSVRLAWNSTKGATSYQIYCVENGTAKWFANSDTNSVTVSGLTAGKTYTLKVRAIRTVNTTTVMGAFGDTVSFTFGYTAPSGLSVDKYSANGVTLSWKPVKYATGYGIYKYDNVNRVYTLYKTVDKNTTSADISGLSANSSYRLAVKANFGTAKSGYSDYIIAYTTPAAPSGLKCVSVTSSTADISWSSVRNAAFYRVYIYDESKGEYIAYGDFTGTSATVKGLSSNKEYKIRVRAVVETSWKTYFSNSSDCLKVKTK